MPVLILVHIIQHVFYVVPLDNTELYWHYIVMSNYDEDEDNDK